MVFIVCGGIGCGVSHWSIHAIQKQKQNMFDGKTQEPHVLCLGLAKCDGACGRMRIMYVFNQVIK